MAWIVLSLDDQLLTPAPGPDGGPVSAATEGGVDAIQRLLSEGHQLTVWTERFAAMPEQAKLSLQEKITQELTAAGYPPLEIWTRSFKPHADIFLDPKAVTFDNDWQLALAQVDIMLEEKGLSQPQQVSPEQNDTTQDPTPEEA